MKRYNNKIKQQNCWGLHRADYADFTWKIIMDPQPRPP